MDGKEIQDLADNGSSRVALLIEALAEDKVSVRWNATRELGRLGEAGREALPLLTALLEARDGTTALWARVAIAKITGDAAGHLPHLIHLLQTKTRLFPGMAAAALGELGAVSAPAVPALINELTAPNPDDRWSAAGALAAIGSLAREAVPMLAHTLEHDADEKVRWYAAYALSEIGSDSAPALPALLVALDDVDEDVRGYAARALGRISASHPLEPTQKHTIIARLQALILREEGSVREEMERTLQQLEEGSSK